MARIGKIARLSREVREELNNRICDGETGVALVEWLNGLPEVQEVLARDFGGRAISEQNFSEWRRGGYENWLRHEEAMQLARDMAENAQELEKLPGSTKLLEHLEQLVVIELTRLLREAAAIEEKEERRVRVLEVARELAKFKKQKNATRRMNWEKDRWEVGLEMEIEKQKSADRKTSLEAYLKYKEIKAAERAGEAEREKAGK